VPRFEASRAVQGLPPDAPPPEGAAPQASPEGVTPAPPAPPAPAGSDDERPLTDADLAPKPEKEPDEKEKG